MTGWHVEPGVLGTTLTTANDRVQDVAGLIASPDGALSAGLGEQCVDILAKSTGFDGVVMEAVSGLLTDQLTNRVGPALGQYSNAIQSTDQAAQAIRAGEHEQAETIAAAMNSTPDGIF